VMTTQAVPADRKAVREFFAFKVNRDALKARPIAFKVILSASAIGFLFGYLWAGGAAALALMIAAALGVSALDRWLAARDVERRRVEKEKNHAEFAALAAKVRSIQANDVNAAFLRVFGRTALDPNELTTLEGKFYFGKERDFFSEQDLREKLGDLHSKSIRMTSKGDYTNDRLRKVRWNDTRREELFFNPTRLVILFLASKQLVICDVQIDSMDGDLREEIQRVSFSKIVNIKFTAERTRFPLSRATAKGFAEDLGFSEEEIKEMEKSFDASRSDASSPWVHEQIVSELRVTQTDGHALAMPIRYDIYFGRHRSALDAEAPLTDDEVLVDGMVHALSNLVENREEEQRRRLNLSRETTVR
jgi:hypothetical protein